RAATGQAAAPPSSVINSRRFIPTPPGLRPIFSLFKTIACQALAAWGKFTAPHRLGRRPNVCFCEGFRMPAARKRCRALRRPAYENLQGRKPREGVRGRGGALQWGLVFGVCDA